MSQGSRSITPPTDVEDKAKDEDEDDEDEGEDDFDNLLTPTKKLKVKTRKLTNFRSMLADSHMNAICLHPERALARKQALAQTSASAPPVVTRRTGGTGNGKRPPAPKSFSPSPSPSPERSPIPATRPARAMKRAPRYAYEYEHSESSESEYGGGGGGSDALDEYEDEGEEELDRIRDRVSIGQESMSSDDVLDLFAYDDSV